MLKLDNFFGLKVEKNTMDIYALFSSLGVNQSINKTKLVKKLIHSNGEDSRIVGVARRQQFLKMIKPLLNHEMLIYNEPFYTKEINTSSEHDRRYDAEEKLLLVALIVASTKSMEQFKRNPEILSIKSFREKAFIQTRFDKIWSLLSQETESIVHSFRQEKSKKPA
jgi:hypothetical protein